MESGQEPRQAYNPADFRLCVAPMMDWLYFGLFCFRVSGLEGGQQRM